MNASAMPLEWESFSGISPSDYPVVPEPAFPPAEQRFAAFHLTGVEECKVVILGLDPYHTPGAAHGLSFSVPNGKKMQPSLRNIYKELFEDLGIPMSSDTDLTNWAKSGVLLLNCMLSVAPGVSKSHRKLGWEKITDKIISALGRSDTPRVFILWGNDAKEKRCMIDESKNLVIASSHPSPLFNSCNQGFFGSRPFSKANDWLKKAGRSEVDWNVSSTQYALKL